MEEVKYTITDGVVLNYIKRMEEFCGYAGERLKYDIYNDEEFDRYDAIRIIRIWEIINNYLSPANRCLYLTFLAYERNAEESLKVFNACGGCIGNIYSLRTTTQRIKNKITNIYEDKYNR